MMDTASKEKAKKIISGWFWQPAESHNFRYKYAVKTMTRFYECLPMEADALKLAIEYLRDVDPGTEIELLGKKIEIGSGWTVKDVWYETAASEQWEGTKSTKIRLFQTFVKATSDSSGDGPYTVENGCRYNVTHTFHWSVTNLPTLPASESGINYTMQGVTRDQETGLFSCVIEKRERVQQDLEKYTSSVDVFEKREDELHLGVKQSKVASTGSNASVANGVLVSRKLSKNDDCTTDIENVTTTEQPAAGATKEYKKTLRGTVETTVDRNQLTALDAKDLKVGETRRSEKTPGGLYNNTKSSVTTEAAGTVATDCTQTVFEHQHVETVNQKDALASSEAAAASGGVIERKTARETEEGTWDVTTTKTTEQPAAGATKEYKKTLRGTVETTVDRNQLTALDAKDLKVGETRRSEKTPGGLYNNTKSSVTTEAAGTVATDCTQTVFEHQHVETVNQKDALASSEATDASGGVIERKTARETEEGTWDVTTTKTTEKAAAGATVEKRKTTIGIVTVTTDRNQVAAKTSETTEMAVGEVRRSELTPGGLFNNQTTTFAKNTNALTIVKACDKAPIVHSDSITENKADLPEKFELELTSETEKFNVVKSRRAQMQENGSWNVVDSTTTYTPWFKRESWSDDNYYYVLYAYGNQEEPVLPSSSTEGENARLEVVQCSFRENDHGSFDGQYTIRNDKSDGGDTLAFSCGPINIATYVYYMKGGKLVRRKFTAKVSRFYGKLSTVQKQVLGQVQGTSIGESCELAGWRTHVSPMTKTHASGVKYTDIVPGEEETVTASSGNSSSTNAGGSNE